MTGPRPAGTMHTHGPDLNPADDDRPGGLPEDGRRRAHHAAAPDHADPQQDERDRPGRRELRILTFQEVRGGDAGKK